MSLWFSLGEKAGLGKKAVGLVLNSEIRILNIQVETSVSGTFEYDACRGWGKD